jgi:hypothetical protein
MRFLADMNHKAAVGLSINTLVIVMISLVILGSGVTLLYKFIGGAEDTQRNLDSRTKAQLELLLVDQGQPVALPLHTKTLRRGDSHTFGLGILNIGTAGDKFQINVALTRQLDNGAIVQLSEAAKQAIVAEWVLFNSEEITIAEQEHRKESIYVQVPENAPDGDYIFTATVTAGGAAYPNPQKFYVTVN